MPHPLVVSIALAVLGPASPRLRESEDVPTLPVVRTWEQLEARPRITVEEGVTVRLGVEATRAKRYGAILLYCLVDGWDRGVVTSTDAVGPVRVRVERRGAPRREIEQARTRAEALRSAGPTLYARTIPITRRGVLDVQVLATDDEPLATVAVEGLDEVLHPWFEFGSMEFDAREALQREGQPVEEHVTARAASIAVPRWESFVPVPRPRGPGLEDADGEKGTPLPRSFPERVDEGFRLRLRGETFEVRFDEPTSLTDARHHFLARWWIDDEPYAPRELVERVQEQDHAVQQVEDGRRLDLHVAFDPERFGARSGDRVGVQLLYCPGGVTAISDDRERLMQLVEWRRDRTLSRMSNKVVFVVP